MNQNSTSQGKGVTSQNGTLFTVQYLICLMNSRNESDDIKSLEIKRVREILQGLQSYDGCSIRFHGSHEYESMDNSVALLTFSALWGNQEYAKAMYNHGKYIYATNFDTSQDSANNEKFYKIAKILSWGCQPRFFWNNQNPFLFCSQGWFGRSPAMKGLLKMTSGEDWVNPFNFIAVLVGQFLGCTSDPSNTDARTLAYVAWQFLKERSWFWRIAYRVWCWQLMRIYPRGIRDVYSRYFGESHPVFKYSNNY